MPAPSAPAFGTPIRKTPRASAVMAIMWGARFRCTVLMTCPLSVWCVRISRDKAALAKYSCLFSMAARWAHLVRLQRRDSQLLTLECDLTEWRKVLRVVGAEDLRRVGRVVF